MRLTDRLSQPQKIVVLIALGVACLAVGAYFTTQQSAAFGWYAYSPITSGQFAASALPNWARLLIWLGLAAAWALASLWLLRPARQAPPAR